MIKTSHKTWLLDILLLTLIISSLYALFLGSRPLAVPDEARYVEIPREMLATGDFITPHLNFIKYLEKPPLFYWLQAGVIKLMGYNIVSWHFITAFLAVFGCILTYWAGRTLYDRSTGWLAGLILASSLLYFCMGHYITLDMAVSVFIAASLFMGILGLQQPKGNRRHGLLAMMTFFAALALLTKGLIGAILPGLVLFCWLALTHEWRQLKQLYGFTCIGLFLVITLPWHILVQLQNPEFFHYYIIEQHFLRYTTLISQHYQPLWWFLPILFIGFYPWTAFLLQSFYQQFPRNWHAMQHDKITTFLWLWTLIIFVFYSCSNAKLIPYILPIWPAVALLIARYLTSYANKPADKSLTLGLLSIILVPLVIAIGLVITAAFFTHRLPASIDLPILYEIAGLFLLLTMINCLAYWRCHLKLQLVVISLSHMLVFSLILLYLPKFDTRSTKPLADIIEPKLTAHTDVIGLYHYYQDIPVYLQRRLTVVSGQEELADGMRYQNASEWMIDDAELKRRWLSDETVFLITDKKYVPTLINQHHFNLFILGHTKRDVLITNKANQGSDAQ